TFSYQWLRDGVAIGGASAATYALAEADIGSAISLRVSYTDGGGTAEQLISAETALVVALADTNNPPTGLVAALGIGEPGQTLEINADSVADQDGLGSFSYQWFVDGEAVPGATADSFLLTEAEIGKQVHAALSYTDGGGYDELLKTDVRLVTAPLSDSFAELV